MSAARHFFFFWLLLLLLLRETELIHLLRRVADKDKRTGEHKRAQHPKSLRQYLWKLAREENIYSGLVLTRVRHKQRRPILK